MTRRLLALATLVTALAPVASARADTRSAWDGISARIATAMESQQRSDGSFRDYLAPGAQPYAEAMVGYGLLLRGTRTGDSSAIDAGLRAISQTVQPGLAGGPRLDSVFKQLGVAAAYNVASARLAGEEAFESRRAAWAAWLQQVRPVRLRTTRTPASNRPLVEAVADLELLRSGIAGGVPGSVLADRAGTGARILAYVNRRWPVAVRGQIRPGPLGPTAVYSDPPSHPLAYHGLSLAMLDRAIALLGASARPTAHRASARMARASWTLTAPDGDLAYWGRSQEQSWALALTAAGVGALSGHPGAADVLRARLAARIDAVHGFGPAGVYIVPALRSDPEAGRSALDPYAGNGVYNGLTLVGAEWTLADQAPGTGSLAADGNGAWLLGHGRATFAVVRHGRLWFAVRMRGGFGSHRGDPRHTFGVMVAKRATSASWSDIVAPPPRARGGIESSGPWLLLGDGRRADAYGTSIRTFKTGVVVVRGGFRTANGHVVRKHVHFTFAPTARGVGVSFRVRRGDVVEVADFRAAGASLGPVDLRLWPPRRRHSLAVSSTPLVSGGFASATLGRVVRVGARMRATRRGTLTWMPR